MVLPLIFGTGVLVTLEFLVIGILPLLAEDFEVSLEKAGWLVSAFALSAALLGPALILLTSHLKPGTALAADLLIAGVSSLIPLAVPGFWMLLATRVLQGAVLTHFVSLASATAAREAGEHNAGRAVGKVNLGVILGTVFAVPAGVALASWMSWEVVFAGLGLSAFAGALMVGLLTSAQAPEEASFRQAMILRKPRFLVHLLLSGALFTAMFSSYSYVAGYLEQVAGFSGRDVALTLFAFGAAGIVGNAMASRWVGRAPVLVTSVIGLFLILIMASLPLASLSPAGLLLLVLVWGATHTAAFVACQVRVMFAEDGAPAFAASLNISVCNLGIALGALVGGKVIAAFGIEAVGLGTIVLGAMSVAVGAVLMLWRVRGEQKPATDAAGVR